MSLSNITNIVTNNSDIIFLYSITIIIHTTGGWQKKMGNDQSKGYGCAILSATVLSTTGIFIRYLTEVHNMEPFVLAFWRNLILVTFLFLLLECCYPMLVEIKRSDLGKLAGHGLILALFNYLWTCSVAVNGAAVATFLVYSSVPFTAILGRAVLGESLNAIKITALCLALGGCLLVSGTAHIGYNQFSGYGLFTGLGSGLCFALYSIIGRSARTDDLNSWTIMLYSFSFAALFLLLANCFVDACSGDLAALPLSYVSLGHSVSGWTVLILLAVGPTLLGFGLYTMSLGYLPSSVVNLIATAEPPMTAVLAFFLLGERLSALQLGGSILIIMAILLLRTTGTLKRILVNRGQLMRI